METNEFSHDNLLMSDSLQGMVPEIEEQLLSYEDSIIIAGIDYRTANFKDVIAGSVVGISFEADTIKVDIRKNVGELYRFVAFCLRNPEAECHGLYLQNGKDEMVLQGPFKITSPKLTDIDHKEKTCTLGLDLIKIVP